MPERTIAQVRPYRDAAASGGFMALYPNRPIEPVAEAFLNAKGAVVPVLSGAGSTRS
jgi:hypothetical protein